MKRILLSQHKENNGTDYLIVDGELLIDGNSIVEYGRLIAQTDEWQEEYRDEFLEIRKKENKIILKSYYTDKDIVGRVIYYLYIIEGVDDFNIIMDYLKEDSKVIDRTFDREKILGIVEEINNNKKLKKKVIGIVLLIIGLSLLTYLIKK
ncbi:hypothetical protein [Myroides phaeus]|uniref:Uncharacterized protein n=1 Tax=Myroides phaeus TaxID=702745 RepID=A0A1G8FL76_9FLAO|nr:hypothetical protein [Myroides phaeus]SDH82885.1 hypothetical protein SAMN05421818_11754 [Myroides phaeus]